MRSRVIEKIKEGWSQGLSEGFRFAKYLEEGNDRYYELNGRRFLISRNTDISTILSMLSDKELLEVLEGQMCQKYR